MAGKFEYLPEDLRNQLTQTALQLVTKGKGILATDDLPGDIDKRFVGFGIPIGAESRRFYRQLLYTSPGIEKYISGAIMYDETVYHKTNDGVPFPEYLLSKGVLSGVQADLGLVDLQGFPGETATQGLDDLKARCQNYYNLGIRFAKWRAAFSITDTTPSSLAIQENVHTLARYALLSQQAGLVPIVEPDVSIQGNFTLDRCQKVMEEIWSATFKALVDHHVHLEGVILKTNMVLPGRSSNEQVTAERAAIATVEALSRTVPPAVPGVGFLSGGQSEEESSINLNAINQAPGPKPWALTFCYGRALQASAQNVWSTNHSEIVAAQEIFIKRCEANSLASLGKYIPGSIPTFA
ncbi:fructose-bisphosphate aldolase A-like [Panonychus citri]|uniref:fructose-bisphosphate aldolase A-like n=1 Tax=Panonychus citri TaxID=50023 RepID=UPI002307C495|nr:fructose-bisphosphate aldolase A-like [Panonychus citri]